MSKTSKRIALLNQKGGTGKTTLAVQIACGLSRKGSVSLMDLDPQGSSTHWLEQMAQREASPAPQLVAWPEGRWSDDTEDMFGTQFLVVDCPPAAADARTAEALAQMDWLIVPMMPSPVDLWASWRLVETLHQARARNPRLKARLVINQAEPGSALSTAMREALTEFGVPAMNTVVRKRAAFRTAALEGVSVYDLGRRGAAAVAEIEAILEELLK